MTLLSISIKYLDFSIIWNFSLVPTSRPWDEDLCARVLFKRCSQEKPARGCGGGTGGERGTRQRKQGVSKGATSDKGPASAETRVDLWGIDYISRVCTSKSGTPSQAPSTYTIHISPGTWTCLGRETHCILTGPQNGVIGEEERVTSRYQKSTEQILRDTPFEKTLHIIK